MGTYINKRFLMGRIENEFFLDLIDGALSLVVLFLITRLVIVFLERMLKSSKINGKMFNTSLKLTKNAVNLIFLLMVVLNILDIFGVNTSSLIATAGIGGVAIGFGAQSLVKDVITGFFILLEGQYYIGEDVVINNISGIVTDFSMRTTQIKDWTTGAVHFIPNGTISLVENRSRLDQIANISLDVPSSYDPGLVMDILKNRLEPIKDPRIVEGPQVLGISNFKDRYFTITILIKVTNGNLYVVQREIRQAISEELKNKGISLYQPILLVEGEK